MKKILSFFVLLLGVFQVVLPCDADNWDPVNKRWRGQFYSWNCSDGISDKYGAIKTAGTKWYKFKENNQAPV